MARVRELPMATPITMPIPKYAKLDIGLGGGVTRLIHFPLIISSDLSMLIFGRAELSALPSWARLGDTTPVMALE
jgi:hypothetical protein